MGSGGSKVSSNKTPPFPNANNFPVQSNPKFQGNGNFPNQYPNQYSDQYQNQWQNEPSNFQNSQPYNQSQFNNRNRPDNFSNNNNYNNNKNFNDSNNNSNTNNNSNDFSYYDGNRGYPAIESQFNPSNQASAAAYPVINEILAAHPNAQIIPCPCNDPQYSPEAPEPQPRIRISEPSQKILRTNVMPLTPIEIEEYRRKGLTFPPHSVTQSRQAISIFMIKFLEKNKIIDYFAIFKVCTRVLLSMMTMKNIL